MTLKRKRSRAPLVIRDNLFDGSRQVKVQPEDCDMYDSARWVVACLGDMPAAVFADWLEERGADLGDDAYAILRGWAANGKG